MQKRGSSLVAHFSGVTSRERSTRLGRFTAASLIDCYLLQINGRPSSVHERYEDALRAGLLRKYQSPRDEIKVFEITSTEEAKQDTVLH